MRQDAAKVVWLETDPKREPRYASLYASHRQMVDHVAEIMHVHRESLGQDWRQYPLRFPVPLSRVTWSKPLKNYAPAEFTEPGIQKNSRDTPGGGTWADPMDVNYVDPETGAKFATELCARKTFEGPIVMEDGRPRNPRGRTGLRGRGLCPKWGPNQCADSIVTRWHPQNNKLQFVARWSGDLKQFRLPGGRVDKEGEVIARPTREAFLQEARNTYTDGRAGTIGANVDTVQSMLDDLFSGASYNPLYQGYVDDGRNTVCCSPTLDVGVVAREPPQSSHSHFVEPLFSAPPLPKP